jgi:heat shock protein HslJ
MGALVTTRMACPGGGDLETRFLMALEATRSWAIETGELHLRNAAGETVATFEHRDALQGA